MHTKKYFENILNYHVIIQRVYYNYLRISKGAK